ncbi:hypothetical protein [Nitrospira sp. Nam74]
MFQFGSDSFFVGRCSCANRSEEGRQQAFRHGVQEILNYAQIRDTSGLYVDTQMVFEETDSPGCPHNTVTVWRLLRVETDRLAQLLAASRQPRTGEHGQPISMPQYPALSIGMSREQIFARFGLPASITMRQGNEFTWEYRRFGLAVEFDRHMLVKSWQMPGARALELQRRSMAQSFPVPSDAAIVDLTPRLRDLEQMGQNSPHVGSRIYNHAVIAPRPMPRDAQRSPKPTDIVASSFNTSPQPDETHHHDQSGRTDAWAR